MERNKVTKEFILFTSNNFPTGGPGATYVHLFCKGIKENAGKISVYLFKGHTYKKYKNHNGRKSHTGEGIKYTYLGVSNRSENKILKIFEDILSILRTFGLMVRLIFRRKKITIFVYSNDLLFNAPVYFFSKLFGIEIISFVPEYLENEEFKSLSFIQKLTSYSFLINYNFLNKLSNKLIVFSNFLRIEYINKGYDGQNIVVQPNLTDLSGWYDPQKIEYTIGYAGTPSIKDGVNDLLSAVKILKDKAVIVKVLIVGDSTGNTSLIPFLQKQCEELEIIKQVTFTGLVTQEKVKEYLNSCEILTVTRPDTKQTKAGFPTKLGEYMACKKVVLATKFGDIENYFTDKLEIVLAEPASPSSIAKNILWILNNLEKSAIIAENGFEKANELLNYNMGVKKIMNFLN